MRTKGLDFCFQPTHTHTHTNDSHMPVWPWRCKTGREWTGNSRFWTGVVQHKIRTGHLVCLIALGVYERTCDIFSYALASFLHLCQSSHGTRITQKNVSHDNHVNKDNSGNNYTTMSSFNSCYLYGGWKANFIRLPVPATQKWVTDSFYIEIPSCF